VKVQQRTLRLHRRVDQLTQVFGDGALDVLLVCLPEEKTSAWRGLEELCCQKTTEPKATMLVINPRSHCYFTKQLNSHT
jgi:hypothetical protein